MKILVTGGSGLLGKSIREIGGKINTDIITTWYSNNVGSDLQLDITDPFNVQYVVNKVKPKYIIHCAAIGDVEFAEKDYNFVERINVEGTVNLANAAFKTGARLVYISSNAVYDGQEAPYSEKSKRKPVNNYGKIKNLAEMELKKIRGLYYLIYRPYMLYGHNYKGSRDNWFTTLYKRLNSGLETKLVNDVYWQPTLAKDVARVILSTMSKMESGESMNVAASQKMTLFEFGQLIEKSLYQGQKEELIQAVDSDYFPSIAKRPVDTEFDIGKMLALYGELKSVEEGVKELRG